MKVGLRRDHVARSTETGCVGRCRRPARWRCRSAHHRNIAVFLCEPSPSASSGWQSWRLLPPPHQPLMLRVASCFRSSFPYLEIRRIQDLPRTATSRSHAHHGNGFEAGRRATRGRRPVPRGTRLTLSLIRGPFQLWLQQRSSTSATRFQMLEGLIDGERIHFPAQAFPGFQRRFQKMAGDSSPGSVISFPVRFCIRPRPDGAGHPDRRRPPKIDIHASAWRVAIATIRLIAAVDWLLGPAVRWR